MLSVKSPGNLQTLWTGGMVHVISAESGLPCDAHLLRVRTVKSLGKVGMGNKHQSVETIILQFFIED